MDLITRCFGCMQTKTHGKSAPQEHGRSQDDHFHPFSAQERSDLREDIDYFEAFEKALSEARKLAWTELRKDLKTVQELVGDLQNEIRLHTHCNI